MGAQAGQQLPPPWPSTLLAICSTHQCLERLQNTCRQAVPSDAASDGNLSYIWLSQQRSAHLILTSTPLTTYQLNQSMPANGFHVPVHELAQDCQHVKCRWSVTSMFLWYVIEMCMTPCCPCAIWACVTASAAQAVCYASAAMAGG